MKQVRVVQYPPLNVTDLIVLESALAIDVVYGYAFHRKWCRLTSTMRTPGHDRELVFGLLFTLGIIDDVRDIISFDTCMRAKLEGRDEETVTVELAHDRVFQPLDFLSGHPRYAGCGVCGHHEVPRIFGASGSDGLFIDRASLLELPAKMASYQHVFNKTGGCHGAALIDRDQKIIDLFEDIGRHNALDKLIGHGLLRQYNFSSCMLVLTSRASFEIVQKASRAGISIVIVMGAVSSLAVSLAHDHDVTLVGFLRAERFNVYTHAHRIGGVLT